MKGALPPSPLSPDRRARGLRRTKAREEVHDLLREALIEERHLDAETLYRQALLTNKSVSLATVYRVLADFERLGLVQVHHFEGLRKVYELEAGQPRDHMVNLDTGEIRHLPPQPIETYCTALARERGVTVVRRSVTLYVQDSAPANAGIPE
jgi:Fur family ferric uptake transcriptional regulator